MSWTWTWTTALPLPLPLPVGRNAQYTQHAGNLQETQNGLWAVGQSHKVSKDGPGACPTVGVRNGAMSV